MLLIFIVQMKTGVSNMDSSIQSIYCFSTLSELTESVGHSLSSAFRPVMFKPTFDREDSGISGTGPGKVKPEVCNSPETGCSEVSTTVDKDEPSADDSGLSLQ